MSDVDYSLDMDLSDLPDAINYVNPPSGVYLITLAKGLEKKIVNDALAYAAEMTIEEILELTDPKKADEVKKGDISSTLFMMNNDQGAGNFKAFALPIANKFGLKKRDETVAKSKGLKLVVTILTTFNKEKDKFFSNVKRVDVV